MEQFEKKFNDLVANFNENTAIYNKNFDIFKRQISRQYDLNECIAGDIERLERCCVALAIFGGAMCVGLYIQHKRIKKLEEKKDK